MTPEQRRDWRDYVLGAKALTLAQRIVLLALETFADYADGTNARPGIEGLMRKCGLTERAVETALKRGRELGLIQRTANGFKRHAAVYRLGRSQIPRMAVRVKTVIPRMAVRVKTAKARTAVRVNGPIARTAVPL
ncbi:helix-turn-helix domain-containing protein [Mycobacteroides abscessus]|uniref:helix-turn-helix domain-containing protein n=1 Tax=Mycobacteroides abscessus TaxID=36809 RepID=UPI0005E5EC65|nr:helix-turn-helix domain-containing protein [Mycobacteroides abscessus]CPV03445.1 Uncharacterised protein [Mycobacteroides abscessus]